jgi:hypothetical protein
MRKFFAVILEVDAKASLQTNTGKIIKCLDDFQKFSDAFKPEQSDDTKFVKMIFHMTSTPSLSHIKTRNRKLVEHLQLHKMHMDESHSGSNEEELIGYFMGFQAEKTYLVGFSDDLPEILTQMILQPGKRTMLNEAKKALTWPSDGCPPFCARARNVTRMHKWIPTHQQSGGHNREGTLILLQVLAASVAGRTQAQRTRTVHQDHRNPGPGLSNPF